MCCDNPKVTVIIPNYNHGDYLSQRIDSVVNQTFQDFEVVILDDCSTDNSREVIELYRNHPKVSRIIYNDSNSNNTFKQWDKGIETARGEFIWIAESDDYCEPTFLDELVPPLLNNSNIVLSYCQSMFFSESGEVLAIMKASEMHSVVNGEKYALEKMMGGTSIPNASMVVFRKSAVEKIPRDYADMRYCGDWLFWTYICLLGDISISGKVLNYYRRHSNNVASKSIKKGLDFLEGNKIFSYLNSNCSPSGSQIKNAIYIRADSYIKVSPLFSSYIKQAAIESLSEIEPGIKRTIRLLKVKYFFDDFYYNFAQNFGRFVRILFPKF
ncbi:MAG TPA: glycosyltransferase [Pyrinomonadaceae bacterium]|nr:glycosyltransferase [Pyrinomonadaceae bacterium]